MMHTLNVYFLSHSLILVLFMLAGWSGLKMDL